MAMNSQFAAGTHVGAGIPGSAETSLTVPVNAAVIWTAPAASGPNLGGSKIEEIRVTAVTTSLAPTTVAGLVYLFLYDGTTYHLFDTIAVTPVTASSTAAPYAATPKTYTNLVVPAGWSLRASQSIAGNASILKVTAYGGDF